MTEASEEVQEKIKVKETQVQRLRKVLGFLEFRGLDRIKMTVSLSGDAVGLSAYPYDITEDEFRLLKRAFSPLKVVGGYEWKEMKGSRKLDGDMEITFTLNSSHTCTKFKPEEMTEEKWEDIREKIMDGTMTIPDCKPQSFKSDDEVEDF